VAEPVKPRIILCTPIPAFKSTWDISDQVIANEIIPIQKEVAAQYNLQVLDLHSLFTDASLVLDDGIHPNDKGAQRLAQLVAEAIKQ
jgi:lysophospholipase L1-like esterase